MGFICKIQFWMKSYRVDILIKEVNRFSQLSIFITLLINYRVFVHKKIDYEKKSKNYKFFWVWHININNYYEVLFERRTGSFTTCVGLRRKSYSHCQRC